MTTNNKYIAWVDIETTGLNPKNDRIIQIGMIKTDKNLNIIDAVEQKFNPQGVKSSPGALEKHHITDEELLVYPTFAEAADLILEFIKDCDLGGHNSIKFDIPFLMEEMSRAGKDFTIERRRLIDTKLLDSHFNQRHLADIYNEYCPTNLDCNAHDAVCDAQMCMEVYKAMLAKHQPTQKEIDEVNGNLVRIDIAGFFIFDENMQICMGKGKYAGKLVEKIDPGYLTWMLRQDFPKDTKKVVSHCLNSLFAKEFVKG